MYSISFTFFTQHVTCIHDFRSVVKRLIQCEYPNTNQKYHFNRLLNKLNEHFLVCYIWGAFVNVGAHNILYFYSGFGINHFLCCKAISVTNQLYEFSVHIVVYSLIL